MRKNPFWLPAHKREVGRIEFDAFVETAPDELRRCTEDFERFKILQRAYGATTSFSDKDGFQIDFGKRKSAIRDFGGNVMIEKGAVLLYRLGMSGDVRVMLVEICKRSQFLESPSFGFRDVGEETGKGGVIRHLANFSCAGLVASLA